jgi:malate dehydrogenase (oxaloacetate-decarboxylating)(NADP+)
MAGVDTEAIENQMRAASLDGLSGYAQDHYGTVKQYHETQYIPENSAAGYQVLREPLWNKGTSGHNPHAKLLLT